MINRIRMICCLLIVVVIMSSVGICNADIGSNTDDLLLQKDLIKSVIQEVSLIREVIKIYKNQVNIDVNLGELISQKEMMLWVAQEIKTLSDSIKVFKQEKKNKEAIAANTLAIMQQSEKITMLIRELKAMNMIVFAKSERTTVNVLQDQIFNVVFTAKDITFGVLNYTVEYNSNELDVVDLCNITWENDLTVPFTVGDITVTEHSISQGKGIIKFRMDKQLAVDQAWSGIVSGIKFKAKVTGESTIITKY